jgi:hypothetical protein
MSGYSGTPLPKKLGLKPGHRVAVRGGPASFPAALGELPEGARIVAGGRGELDLVLLFVTGAAELDREFTRWAGRLTPAGMLWVAWPKKSAKVPTDLVFAVVQGIGLRAGLVDVKICAIDDTWSGLKFVRRLKDRPNAASRSRRRD